MVCMGEGMGSVNVMHVAARAPMGTSWHALAGPGQVFHSHAVLAETWERSIGKCVAV
jgi:hypothetical protein